jgi:divalent metal cation (Fe/Co/Zn/Cd) transporter
VSEQGLGLVQLGPIQPTAARKRLERHARALAWGGIAWHVVEFAIAIGAGIAAGSIALIGFGADSLIEALAGGIVVWLFTGNRRGSHAAERRAQLLIAVTFFVLAAYVGVEAVRGLVNGDHPAVSWIGIALAAITAAGMPLLAAAKRPSRRLDRRSSAPTSRSRCSSGSVRTRSSAGGGPIHSPHS